jgi:UDP-glucose 4-epimerase
MHDSIENILVTGGAGYIGSHVVRDLGEQGYKPIVYDNLSTGNKNFVLYGDFIKGDLKDTNLITKIIKKYKIKSVIHFAAYIVVEESVNRPIKYYNNNFFNSLNLIKSCIENGVENFVFSSSAAVYGIPEEFPVKENSQLNPVNPYGRSKMFTEILLEDISYIYKNFNYIALRYFNVAGADKKLRIGQKYENPTHLITLALKTALGEYESLNIFGTDYNTPDGTAIRDYIHIDDLSNAHILCLNYLKKERKSEVFNCGYGKGYSVLEVLNTTKKVTKVNFKTINSTRREGDPPILIADSNLIKDRLDWSPKYNDLEFIINSAWEWEKKLKKGE